MPGNLDVKCLQKSMVTIITIQLLKYFTIVFLTILNIRKQNPVANKLQSTEAISRCCIPKYNKTINVLHKVKKT